MKQVNKDYRKITGDLAKAQRQYRKTVDDSYDNLLSAIAVLESTDDLATVEADLTGLLDVIKEDGDHEKGRDAIKAVTAMITAVPGTNAVASELSKAKKALRKKREKPKKAIKAVKKAIKAFDKDLAARRNAGTEVIATLNTFEAEIRDTIGLRQQDRLSLEQATAISGCRPNIGISRLANFQKRAFGLRFFAAVVFILMVFGINNAVWLAITIKETTMTKMKL